MRIGNTSALAFEIVPVTPSWELRYSPEVAGWAGLAIWVDGMNLCSHIVPGDNIVREHVFVPLGPLADWLVGTLPALRFEARAPLFSLGRDIHADMARWADAPPPSAVTEDEWLDTREAFWKRHFIRAGADGSRLPDLALLRDEDALSVTWRNPRFVGRGQPQMLWTDGAAHVEWDEASETLQRFVLEVRESLRGTAAEEVYSWVAASDGVFGAVEMDEAVKLFTARPLLDLARLLGVEDPGRLFDVLDIAAGDPEGSVICQAVRDLSPSAPEGIGQAVRELQAKTATDDGGAPSSWRDARKNALDAARSADTPEAAGQVAATALRRWLGLRSGAVGDATELLGQMSIRYGRSGIEAARERMIVGARREGCAAVTTFANERTTKRWGERFEQGRALGHLLLDPMPKAALGAASGPFTQATRRRRSGAFSAEFLLPQGAMAKESQHRLDGAADGAAFGRVLETYGVGATTAAHQLFNHGWLSSSDVRDELIESFAVGGQ